MHEGIGIEGHGSVLVSPQVVVPRAALRPELRARDPRSLLVVAVLVLLLTRSYGEWKLVGFVR